MAARKKNKYGSAQTTLEFISTFFSHPNAIFCIQDAPIPGGGWPPCNMASFVKRYQELSDADASFYVSTMFGSDNHRNAQDNFESLAAIVLDDIGTKGVNLTDVPLPPSYVIESSEGNYQCGYVFDTPLEDIDLAKIMVKHIYGLGVADGGGALVNKFVRLPWGINNKMRGDGHDKFPCRLIEMSGTRYTVDEVCQAFEVNKTPRYSSKTEIRDLVTEALIEENWVIGTKGNGILLECPWGENHTSGKNDHAIYYPIGTGDAPTQRGFKCHHDSCRDKRGDDLADHLRSSGYRIPISAEIEYHQQRYCLIEQSGLVGDFMSSASEHDPTTRLGDFKNARTYLIDTGRLTTGNNPRPIWKKLGDEWQDGFDTKRVSSIVYDPVKEDRIVSRSGKDYFNLYRRPSHLPSTADPEIYLAHINHIIPDEIDRELFHDWVAYKVQNPDKRSYMYLMVTDGVFGIGRSLAGKVIAEVFQAGVVSINFNVFTGKSHQWTDWKDQSQLVVIEEIKDDSNNYTDAVRAYEEIKLNVDVSVTQVEIHKKFQAPRQSKAYYNVLGFSNHADAIRIPAEDRRIYVAKNTPTKRTDEEYREVSQLIGDEQEIANLYWWLMNRNLHNFDPHNPPESIAKRQMIHLTKTDNEQILEDIVASMPGDMVFRHQLRQAGIALLQENGYDANSREWGYLNRDINALWKKLEKLEPKDKHGGRLKLPGMEKGESVRILRNVKKWKGTLKPRSKTGNDHLAAEVAKNQVTQK